MNAPASEPTPAARPLVWVHLLVISAVCIAVYSNTLDVPFVFDDTTNIVLNRHIRVETLRFDALMSAAFESPSPRPLSNLSFALNYAFGGTDPRSYHVVNIGIHLATGWVVYLLAAALLGRLRPESSGSVRGLSLLAALVFVAHPIQTQTVNYVVQRMTSLATLLYLVAILAYVKGRERGASSSRWIWWTATGISGVLAFSAKQIAITLPVALLLVEWQCFRDASGRWLRERAWPVLGLLALCVLPGIAYLAWFGLPGYAGRDFSMGERVLTELRVLVFYLSLLALPLPARLNLTHAFPISRSLLDPISTIASGSFLIALLALALALRKRERLLSFTILWFFLTTFLESSIFPLELVFEHRLYLPMFGFALLATDVMWRLGRGHRGAVLLIGSVVIATLGCASYLRNAVWTDAVVLWTDVAHKNPRDGRAHYNLALAYEAQGLVEESERQYERVLELDPSSAGAVNALGMIYEARGEVQRALDRYTEAARLAPNFVRYPINRALLLARTGRVGEANRVLDGAADLEPDYARDHFAIGYIRELGRRFEEAKHHYQRALDLEPEYADAHFRLASVLALEGRITQALHHSLETTRIDPRHAEARRLTQILLRGTLQR